MPETPDFDQIALGILDPIIDLGGSWDDVTITPEFAGELRLRAAEQLRAIWNARGAADRALLTEHFNEAPADVVANALRTLDR